MGGNSLPYRLPGVEDNTKICELSVSLSNHKDNIVLKLLLQMLSGISQIQNLRDFFFLPCMSLYGNDKYM